MIIAITGTPGTGKTYIAERMQKVTGFTYLNVNKYIKQQKIYDEYDRKDKTYDVEVKRLAKVSASMLKKYHYEKSDQYQRKFIKILSKYKDKTITTQEFLKLIESIKHDKNALNKNIILDSHLSQHMLFLDYIIVIKASINTISRRLKKRKYPAKKIKDNIESEIFDICLEEARQNSRNIMIIDNS